MASQVFPFMFLKLRYMQWTPICIFSPNFCQELQIGTPNDFFFFFLDIANWMSENISILRSKTISTSLA